MWGIKENKYLKHFRTKTRISLGQLSLEGRVVRNRYNVDIKFRIRVVYNIQV